MQSTGATNEAQRVGRRDSLHQTSVPTGALQRRRHSSDSILSTRRRTTPRLASTTTTLLRTASLVHPTGSDVEDESTGRRLPTAAAGWSAARDCLHVASSSKCRRNSVQAP